MESNTNLLSAKVNMVNLEMRERSDRVITKDGHSIAILRKGKRQLRRLNNGLLPKGAPQERVLGPLGLTARYGRAWIDALYRELPPLCSEHLAVHLPASTEEDDA